MAASLQASGEGETEEEESSPGDLPEQRAGIGPMAAPPELMGVRLLAGLAQTSNCLAVGLAVLTHRKFGEGSYGRLHVVAGLIGRTREFRERRR